MGLYSNILALIVHIPIQYVMVFTLDLSIVGYATSGLISGSLALIGCYLLMYLHPEVSKAISMPDR